MGSIIHHIPICSSTAIEVQAGQILRISTQNGGQVVDLFAIAAGDLTETLSAGHTTDYNKTLFFTTGHILYSNQSRKMFTILEDQAGPHIMLYAPCSRQMYQLQYGLLPEDDPHPNCLDNLSNVLAQYGMQPHQITIPLNIFMNIGIQPDGAIEIKPPRAKAGEFLELRAEIDLVVALSACPAGLCNDFSWLRLRLSRQPISPDRQTKFLAIQMSSLWLNDWGEILAGFVTFTD